MIQKEELEALLKAGESDRVEFTEATKDTDKFAKAVCAFANDFPNHRQPGYLIIGAKDDGNLAGIEITDQILTRLGEFSVNGNILPLPAISVKKFPLTGGEVAVVEVLPSDFPPVRYKGVIWVRVGPRQKYASEQDERILTEKRVAGTLTFDARPCPDAALEDLDTSLFLLNYLPQAVDPEIIKENNRDIKHQLASLGFFDLRSDQPTYAGTLLFGTDPLRWLSGAYIQFVRYAGVDFDSEVVAEDQLKGDLGSVLSMLNQIIRAHNTHKPVFQTILQEKQVYQYPEFAVREFVTNAVLHRSYELISTPIHFYWYSDHIQIESPGGLFGGVTPDTLETHTAYRNRVIADALKTLGFVNRFGQGVARAQSALRRGGHPPAEFDCSQSRVSIKIKGVQ